MTALRDVAKAICKSRTCRGAGCCQHPANMGLRHDCPVDKGNFDDAAQAATEAILGSNAAYKFKVYRVEFVVELGEVDQYGKNFRAYETFAFPTVELAMQHLPKVAHQTRVRWVPNNPPHGYCEAHVRYREVDLSK